MRRILFVVALISLGCSSCADSGFDIAETPRDSADTETVIVSDSGQPSDSISGQETSTDSGPVVDTGMVTDSGKDSGMSSVACTKTLSCPGGATGNNCCYRRSAPDFSTCNSVCAPDEWQFACDGPEDCPSGTVCCATIQSNGFNPALPEFGWNQVKSYCKPASLGCNVDMKTTSSMNTAMPCHTSADCPSTFPKCCQHSSWGPNGQRSCVASETDINNFSFEGYKCYDPAF